MQITRIKKNCTRILLNIKSLHDKDHSTYRAPDKFSFPRPHAITSFFSLKKERGLEERSFSLERLEQYNIYSSVLNQHPPSNQYPSAICTVSWFGVVVWKRKFSFKKNFNPQAQFSSALTYFIPFSLIIIRKQNKKTIHKV